jgi:CRP/FNR family transcriptional regulator, cyclic AMP receptor protein
MPSRSKTKDVAQVTNRGGTKRRTAARIAKSPEVFDADKFISTVGLGRTSASYRAKEYIFRQGAKCDAVYFIRDGQVQMTIVSKQGKERAVGIFGAGAFIGEGCLAGHPLYLASARALMPSTVVRVETDTLRKAINDHPEMSRLFMAFLLQRNSQIESDLVDLLFNSSEKRLARLLIMLAQVGQEAAFRTVTAPISQEVLASRVGTTRSRINYFLNKFRKLGLIEYNGKLKVHSSLMNVIIRD